MTKHRLPWIIQDNWFVFTSHSFSLTPSLWASRWELWSCPVIELPPLPDSIQSREKLPFLVWFPKLPKRSPNSVICPFSSVYILPCCNRSVHPTLFHCRHVPGGLWLKGINILLHNFTLISFILLNVLGSWNHTDIFLSTPYHIHHKSWWVYSANTLQTLMTVSLSTASKQPLRMQ